VELMAESGRIFISYRREETAYSAGWLFDRLGDRFGGQIFKDVDSIEPGDDWVEVITTVVASCDVLLALIGDRWLTVTDEDGRRRLDDPDDFVRLEIEAALTRNVRVIPILVEGARMPRDTELPPSLAKLARRQALVLSPTNFDTSRLLRVLDKTLTDVRIAQEDAAAISAEGVVPDREATEVSEAPEPRGPHESNPIPSVPPEAPAMDPEVLRNSPSVPEAGSRTGGAGPPPDEDHPKAPDREATEPSSAAPGGDRARRRGPAEDAAASDPAPHNPPATATTLEGEPVTGPGPAMPEEQEAGRPGRPAWRSAGGTADAKPSPTPAVGFLGHRLPGRRRRLLGVGAAGAVAVLAGAAYALTHHTGQDPTGGPSQDATSTQTSTQPSATRLVSTDVVLVPIVAQGSIDPVLHKISIPDGSDLGPVNGVSRGSQSWPSQSRDGSLLAYRSAPPGSGFPAKSGTLWVAALGREPESLFTHEPRDQQCLSQVAWSPDGDRVALVCEPDQGPTDSADSKPLSEVVTGQLNDEGRIDPDQLAAQFDASNSPGSDITKIGFAHDGAIVADYVRGRRPGVYLARPGDDPRRLTTQDDRGVAPSPTQNLIAFTREGDLYVASTDGKRPPCGPPRVRATDQSTQLCNLTPSLDTEGSNVSAADPTWSWSGQAIAYRVNDLRTGKGTIHLIGLNAGPSVPLTSPADVGAPGWGPR
jgi:hypothetical protein